MAWDLYPRLPFEQADVLVLGRIGKDISGTGLDCNVVGRYTTSYARGGPDITRIVALDTTPLTGGNVNGIGVVDVTTQRLFDKLSFAETYPNALTSTATTAVKIPMVMPDDRLAIQAAIRTSTIPDPAAVRLAWVRDTLALDQVLVTPNMAAEADALRQRTGHRPRPPPPVHSHCPPRPCNLGRHRTAAWLRIYHGGAYVSCRSLHTQDPVGSRDRWWRNTDQSGYVRCGQPDRRWTWPD